MKRSLNFIAAASLFIPILARAQTQPATAPAAEVSVVATVEAFWSADQYAKTSGYVSEVKHDIGDRVKKGDVLAILYVPELEKSLLQAEATLAARVQVQKASEAAVEQSRQALAVTEGQLQGYEADLKLANITLQRQQELSAGKAATAQQLDDAKRPRPRPPRPPSPPEKQELARSRRMSRPPRPIVAMSPALPGPRRTGPDGRGEIPRRVHPNRRPSFDGVVAKRQAVKPRRPGPGSATSSRTMAAVQRSATRYGSSLVRSARIPGRRRRSWSGCRRQAVRHGRPDDSRKDHADRRIDRTIEPHDARGNRSAQPPAPPETGNVRAGNDQASTAARSGTIPGRWSSNEQPATQIHHPHRPARSGNSLRVFHNAAAIANAPAPNPRHSARSFR